MDSGFIKIYRRFFEHDIWKENRVFSKAEAWIDILRSAEFREAGSRMIVGNKSIKIDRGSMAITVRFLAERWGWSRHKVFDFLRFLRDNNMTKMGTVKGTKQTILTVSHYDIYNPKQSDDGTTKGQNGDNKGTKVRTKRTKEIIPPYNPPTGEDEFSFDKFWDLYDKKVGEKDKLRKKFDALALEDRKKIFDHVPRYKQAQPDKKFRKDPSTYLNQKSWNDEIVGQTQQTVEPPKNQQRWL